MAVSKVYELQILISKSLDQESMRELFAVLRKGLFHRFASVETFGDIWLSSHLFFLMAPKATPLLGAFPKQALLFYFKKRFF